MNNNIFTSPYNREGYISFLQHQFLPEDFALEQTQVYVPDTAKYISNAIKLGESKSLDLVVYEVKHTGKNDPRVSLSKEAFRLLAGEWCQRALILFVPEDNNSNYRLSLIEIELLGNPETAKIERKYSNPRRYSYLLGEGIGGYTPEKYLASKGRIINDKDLFDRFSVEVLTKAFYNELSDWYAWAVKIVRFPNKLNDENDDDKYNHEAVIRLVTRLIFVWFLKQKELIPDEFFNEEYIRKNLLENFDPHATASLFGKSEESKYYKAILQNLFFAMLNSPITSAKGEMERRFIKASVNGQTSDFDNKKLMRYETMFSAPNHFVELANKGVPFLNGGLFDCLDDRANDNFIDGFSDNTKINQYLIVPDYLFFGEEVGKEIDLSDFYGDKKKKKVSARGIIDILKRYNFTVEENTPFDQEVSLDPELLGKVFENLLAMYNPETKATARKQTGSFYTPREIVQYMVDESLIAHLKRTVGEELEDEYRKLMKYTDEDISLTDEQKRSIIHSLHDCKILDPACGSGAFPMGVLQQMVHILSRLDESNEIWKEIMLDEATNDTRSALKYSDNNERTEAVLDIERSFDESINRPDYARKLYLIERCIYGVDIQSIAIQISKLRFFISLVIDQKRTDNPQDNFGIRPLPNLEAKFVAANTLIGLNKSEATLFDTPEIKAKEAELKIANHKIFGAKTFRTKTKYKERVKELRTELSDILLEQGYVSDTTAQLLKDWDMFDQNTSSPFFDPEWMFGIQDGFDIVIANPPYVEFKKLHKDIKNSLSDYLTTKGKYDLYVAFIERSQKLLISNGVHTFINPTTFLNREYGKALRSFINNNFKIISIVDFSDTQVFESATTYTGVFVFQTSCNPTPYDFNVLKFKSGESYRYKNNKFDRVNSEIAENFSASSDMLSKSEWNLNSPVNDSVVQKMLLGSIAFADMSKYIFQGIATGKDEVFFITEEIIQLRGIERDLLHPIFKGKDVGRYTYTWSGVYIIYPYSIDTNKVIAESEIASNYPNLYAYLLSCRSLLSGRDYFDKSTKQWYELWCERVFQKFKQPKIVNSEISNYNKFTIDYDGYLGNTKVFSTVLKEEYQDYYNAVLGVLNSKLMEFFHKSIASPKAGGAYEYKTQFISKYPIKIDRQIYAQIANIVDGILVQKSKDPQFDTSALEAEIDQMVYQLYNLTPEEIAIIENK